MKPTKQQQKPIGFFLAGIRTEQFALLSQSYKEDEPVQVNAEVKYGASIEDRMIVVYARCNFTHSEVPFITIEVSQQYIVEPESFTTLINDSERTFTIPKDLAAHLVLLTVCTARGVLHARLENSAFSRFFIPTINIASLVQEPIVLNY